MIVPFSQTDVKSTDTNRIRPLPIFAVFLGLCFAFVFSRLWPDFEGIAAWAMWPLGLATGMFSVTFGASLWGHQMHWDMLIAGKLLTLAGTLLFFVASL